MNKMKSWRGLALLLGTIFIALTMISPNRINLAEAKSADDAVLRFIFTTDIHGQMTSMDYELGTELNVGGLARAYNLIKQTRKEIPNNMTFDIGDVIYDYTTEYIYATNQSALQPVYEAMNIIGYDAITLGNHEFDYDYDYLLNQLTKSGLKDKVVLSNLTDSKTGKYPFQENMLVKKTLTTSQGNKMEVKIGVIGETFPYLSTKVQDFTGVLKVEDIVANVKAQAKKLKSQGADIIVVLSHSGMGPETVTEADRNVSYALTKIDEVDAILCGHEHNQFPSEDTTGTYYKLSGVDKTTGLVNGKNLVMASDRGSSIGIVDLKLQVVDDKVTIVDRESNVRQVTNENTIEEKSISALIEPWSDELLEYSQVVIGEVNGKETIENFNGLVEDNSAMQLLNDAKRAYALSYIHTKAEAYANYPVIAASSYISYGESSYLDYVNISGKMTEADLASLQKYNGYTAIYRITGKQLKEWLEWSASAYEQVTADVTWSNKTMAAYMSSTGLKSLIAESWLENWSTYYVFDGIDYVINPSIPARYNQSGVKINTTNRITSLTYNGQPIKDDMVFALACGKLAKTTEANKGVDKQAIYKGYVRTQGIIRDYIEQRCKLGSLSITPDYNWSVALNSTYQFITRTTSLAADQIKNSSWHVKTLGTLDHYIYSVGSYSSQNSSTALGVLVTSTYTDVTSAKVKVAVAMTAKNELEELKVLKGDFDVDYDYWNIAESITGNYFYANSNGIYTVYAKDSNGNRTVAKVCIDNIYNDILAKPTVATYTNRKTKISGKADPNTTIVIETTEGTYKTVVDSEGAFSYALPAQKSGSTVKVYSVDEKNSYISETAVVTVKRTGPNQPYVYEVNNTTDLIYGNLNDDDATAIAVVGSTVYAGTSAAKELYKNCADLYNSKYKVVVTSISIDQDLEYSLQVPPQKVGTSIKIYTLDHLSRASRVNTVKVVENGPNVPTVYPVLASDDTVYGKVTSSTGKAPFEVFVMIGTKIYEGQTDDLGYFAIKVDATNIKVGKNFIVYAKDKVGTIKRMSFKQNVIVESPDVYVSTKNELYVDDLYTTDLQITGTGDTTDTITLSVLSNKNYSIYQPSMNKDGDFIAELSTSLKVGDVVYAVSRYFGNIIDVMKLGVEVTVPSKPYFDAEVTNITTKVVVFTDVMSTMVLKVGKETFKSSKGVYVDSLDEYKFTFTIPKTSSSTEVKVYAYNDAGKSSTRTTTITRVVPDAPTVNKVSEDAKKVTGTVSIVGNTRIYAQIGDKVYNGTVKKNGSFTINIPKAVKNAKITVYTVNEVGTGLKTTVQVKKSEK